MKRYIVDQVKLDSFVQTSLSLFAYFYSRSQLDVSHTVGEKAGKHQPWQVVISSQG